MVGAERQHGGRRGRELPGHGVGQLAARRRRDTGRHLDGVGRGHRQTIDQLGLVLEAQRAGADPLPATLHLRRHGRRHIERFQLLESGQLHHGLVERDAQRRRHLDVTFGLEAEHLERAGRRLEGFRLSLWREGGVDGVAGAGRGQCLGRAVEVLDVVIGDLPLAQTGEHRADGVGTQWLTVDDRRTVIVVLRRRITGAELYALVVVRGVLVLHVVLRRGSLVGVGARRARCRHHRQDQDRHQHSTRNRTRPYGHGGSPSAGRMLFPV